MKQFNLPASLTEEQLIRYSVKGDRVSQKLLYDRFASKMFGVCMRYAPDYQIAEDILQEGFVKAFKNLDRFRFEGSFEGWLRKIMVNTAIEMHRRKNLLYTIVDVENTEVEFVDENALSKLAVDDIMMMIASLSPGYKTVFCLYAIEGFSHKEIAEQLNISEGTSKSQLARARYILMEMVEQRTGLKHKASGQ
ncbi:MAG: RNA polymerase sigma factor [Chitinophagales bacterium]